MVPLRAGEIAEAVGGRLSGEGNSMVASVVFDSGKVTPGALFVAIVGEKRDGHDYIGKAYEAGASAVFSSRAEAPFIPEGRACILVEDTVKALQALGAYCRGRFPVPVVGITGSVGKTTTKEMVAAALSARLTVLKTEKNLNSQIGVPVMMTYMEPGQEAAVIEMGMSQKGEMGRLAQIVRPDMAIITNIGVSHIGNLGSKENIRQEKLHIIDCFQGKGTLLLNGDDPMLMELLEDRRAYGLEGVSVFTFGLKGTSDFRAEHIESIGETTRFICAYPDGRQEITLHTFGDCNVSNALAALAAAWRLGIPLSEAGKGLTDYRPGPGRGERTEKNGIVIIDETYNASPDSIKGTVDALLQMKGVTERIAVLGDILELGGESREYHYETGVYTAGASCNGVSLTELVTVGREAAAIGEGARENVRSMKVCSFPSNREAITYLKERLHPGCACLIKGSRGMRMEEITEALLQ